MLAHGAGVGTRAVQQRRLYLCQCVFCPLAVPTVVCHAVIRVCVYFPHASAVCVAQRREAEALMSSTETMMKFGFMYVTMALSMPPDL